MNGHGHVIPNVDGSKARCGGPGICAECSRELALKNALGPLPVGNSLLDAEVELCRALNEWKDAGGNVATVVYWLRECRRRDQT